MDSVEEDLADAKSARTEQMRLMLSIQEQQQSMGVMLGRIDERTARDYPK